MITEECSNRKNKTNDKGKEQRESEFQAEQMNVENGERRKYMQKVNHKRRSKKRITETK
jgi:hypothetical protein